MIQPSDKFDLSFSIRSEYKMRVSFLQWKQVSSLEKGYLHTMKTGHQKEESVLYGGGGKSNIHQTLTEN